MAKDDVLYANPAEYVVDVIGMGVPLPSRGGSGYRKLTADEWTLLQNCPECIGALNQAKWVNNSPLNAYGQHTSQVEFAQFSCMGMQFIRVANPAISGPAITSVWNHPAPITVTGLKGIPSMSTTPHLEPAGVGAYHPNPWRQLSVSEITLLHQYCPQFKTQFTTVRPQIVNGAQVWHLTCGGYAIMVQASTSGTFWYVYNHPGQLVFNMKQYERPAVPSRTALRGVPHWVGAGSSSDEGVGAYVALPNPQNRPEISAAIDFLAYYDANGCSRSSLPVVVALQNAYNASGLPGQLTTDGEYGPNTQRALQNVMDEAQADAGAGPSQQAPANCFPEYGSVPSIPALDVTPASPTPATPSGTYTAPVTTVTGDTGQSNKAMLLIGGAVAAVAAGGGYYYWKKHKRGR